MKHSKCFALTCFLMLTSLRSVAAQANKKPDDLKTRTWSLADGSQEGGELVSVEIVIKLPNGETRNIPFSNTSRADQRFITHWLATDKNAKAIAPVIAKPTMKALAKPLAGKPGKKESFTSSGDLKLTDNEILGYLNEWKEKKPELLDTLRATLNARATTNGVSPDVVQETKDTFKFVSRENVLVVPRAGWSNNDQEVFKYDVAGYPTLDYGEIEVLKIVDKRTIFASLNGSKAFIEGVDAMRIPIGKWSSQYMFRKVGTRKVPAAIGEDEVLVIQAVSLEGFPKDIIVW